MLFLLAELTRGAGNTLIQSYHFDDDRYVYSYDRGFKLSDSKFTTKDKSLWPWNNFPGKIVYDSRSGVLYHVFSAGAFSQAPVTGGENYDVFVVKTDLQGNPLWKGAVRLLDDFYAFSSGVDAAVDQNGNLYVAYFNDYSGNYIYYQKILPDGTLAWDGNATLEGNQSLQMAYGVLTDPVLAIGNDGYVYVAYTSSSWPYIVYVNAFSMSDGSKKWASPIRISPTSGPGYYRAEYPDIMFDGNLFWVAWRADNDTVYDSYNVYIRWLNATDGTLGPVVKVNVGDYAWGQQWYGTSSYEHMVSMAYDGSRYIYLAFPGKFKSGVYQDEVKVLLQKFDTVTGTTVWVGDVVAQQAYDPRIERVPQVTWDPVRNLLWVVWLRGGYPAYFNAFDVDGNPWFAEEIEVPVGVNGDNIVLVENSVFIGNHAGDRVYRYSVYGLYLDDFKPNVFVNYYTQAQLITSRILPGNIYSARLRVGESIFYPSLPDGAFIAFSANGGGTWLDEGTSNIENGNVITFGGSDQGNDFRAKIVLNGDSLVASEPPYCDLLVLEATDVAWADASVSLNKDGSSSVGELDFSPSQEIVQYAGPGDEVYAYVFVKNMGNNDNLSAKFVLGTTDKSPWNVTYEWWEWNGTDWTPGSLISDGSAPVNTTSFALPSYDGTPGTVKALRISVNAPLNGTSGDTFSVQVNTTDADGNWHDSVVFRVLYMSVLPDLEISYDGSDYVGYQVYNLDGSYQSLNDTQDAYVERDFYMKLTNRGDDGQNITLYATPSGGGWNVTYYLWNGTDWTLDSTLTELSGETFVNMLHGETRLVKAVVYPDSTVPLGNVASFQVKAVSSLGNYVKEDVVVFSLRRVSSALSLSDNITRVLDLSQTWSYTFNVTNTSGDEQYFYVKQKQSLPAGWGTSYYDGASDITTDVVGSGYRFVLSDGATKTFMVNVITPSSGVGTSGAQVLQVWAYSGGSDNGTVLYSEDFSAQFSLIDSNPDLMIFSENNLVGNNTYEVSPSTQVVERYVVLGRNGTYTLVVEEDGQPNGESANTYLLSWNSTGLQTVYVYDGFTPVTAPYETPSLTSTGQTHTFSVVFDTSTSPVDETTSVDMKISSTVNPSEVDTVRIIQHATYPPDLYAKRTSPTEGIVVGSYVFPEQLVQGGLAWGSSAEVVYRFWIHNRRTVSEAVNLTATSLSGPWSFVYEEADDPDNPTTWTAVDPVNSTLSYVLSPGQRVLLRLRVWVNNWSLLSEGDEVNATVSVVGNGTSLEDSLLFNTVVGAGHPHLSADKLSAYCESGENVTLSFKLSNVANVTSEAFLLKATLSAAWSVEFSYYENGTWHTVPSGILSTGWQAPSLSPGEELPMKITVSSTYPSGSVLDIHLEASSQVDPTITSSLDFHYVMVEPKPDLVVKEGSTLYGNDIYGSYTEHTATSSISFPAVFQVYLQNDDVVVADFSLEGRWSVSEEDWRVRIIDNVHGDITDPLSSGVAYSISPGANVTITVQVYQLSGEAIPPEPAVVEIKVLSLKNPLKWDGLKLFVEPNKVKVGLEVFNSAGDKIKAKVYIQGNRVDVNGEGEVYLLPGIYTFRVESPGYITETKVIEIKTHSNLTFTLTKANLFGEVNTHAYPTRVSLTRGEVNIVYVAPQGEKVKVALYDVRGRLVKVLFDGVSSGVPERIVWRLVNEGGEKVVSGVYFIVVRSQSGRVVKKLFVVP